MSQKNHIVIYSHGFGVKKDDRGLLTDIANSLKSVESILFDYNDIDEEKNQLTAKPFSEQVEILKKNIADARENNPNAIIDIICHSQGAVIVALAKPAGIRKIIFIAPPFSAGIEKMVRRFNSRPGTEINMRGISKITRSDGSLTIVPAQYFAERAEVNPKELYKNLSELTELIIINAKQDEVLDENNISDLGKAEIIDIDGNHGFSGDSRKKLLEIIASKIV